MFDIIDAIYYLVDENLPAVNRPDPAAQAFFKTFSPEQEQLFNAFYSEFMGQITDRQLALFRYLVKLGLHIP